MGLLVNGQWQDKEVPRTGKAGEFVRTEADFRHRIGEASFPAENHRYHLFVNAGCPWAYRTLLYRSIKGLTDVVSVSLTQPAMGAQGWTFGDLVEPILGAKHIHDVYRAADATFSGRCTVPVLWDKRQSTIVNNESSEIIRMFNSVFDHLPGVEQTNYYPETLQQEIDALNELIYNNVNNGVYRCGFAQSQAAYETAFEQLFATLDELDTRLATQRYLCGAEITEADWRLFATLVRFDAAYVGQFKCNRNLLSDYEYLWPYTRDLYQQPGVAETVDMAAIKGIYYGSRPPRIIPKGPRIDFAQPHTRDTL